MKPLILLVGALTLTRGRAASTVQMNDDTLYSAGIVEAVDGSVRFSVPEVDVYMAVQS